MKCAGKEVLIIATGFPPLGGSGVQRTTKFVKYLSESGWRSSVITADPDRDRPGELDESLLAEVPASTEILREPYWNPAVGFLSTFSGRGRPTRTFGTIITPSELPATASTSILRRSYHGLRRLLVAPVGDPLFYWSRRVRHRAFDFIRRQGCTVIYTSGSPFSTMLLGLWLKRRTGLPLVVDFRDPWTLFYPELARGLRFRIDRHFEKKVLAEADAVICNHEPMKADFERIEPHCRGKCEVIPNGYDPRDFAAPAPPIDQHVLAHVGIAWEQSPHPVLKALSALHDNGALPAVFRLRFLGGLPPSSFKMIGELGLEDVVQVEPRIAHAPAVKAMRSAGCLLLLLVESSAGGKWYPGKLFEYMASGRPVLCVSPEGIAAELVRKSGCGVAVSPDDATRLENLLAELTSSPEGFEAKHYNPQADVLARYDRRKQAGRLAAVMERVSARGGC